MLPTLRHGFMPTLTDDLFGTDLMNAFWGANDDLRSTLPSVNIREDDEAYHIDLAAPGLDKKDFRLHLDRNVLEISSHKEAKNEEKDGNRMLRREFHYASFCRTFALPDSANSDKIKANYADGILHVEVPKRDEAKVRPARQIEIE